MRIKFILCYDGCFVNGWTGSKGIFVKDLLENAFKKLTNEKVEFFCSGRTDSGVHALEQMCHCDYISEKIAISKIKDGLNFYLPEFIRIILCEEVSLGFHSRFIEQKREYMYLIYNNDFEIPFLKNRALLIKRSLDVESMKKAMNYMVGMHDFSTFCPKKYTGRKIRTIDKCYLENYTDIFSNKIFKLCFVAKAFAYHQIRNIVGGLIEIGKNNWTFEEFIRRFELKDRTLGGNMVPSYGLYFVRSILC